jgi:hypothetical protein
MKPLFAIVQLSLIVGCSEAEMQRSVSDVVSAWGELGMYLPPEQDVEFIRDRLPQSLAALRAGLTNDTEHVRMSSAYVAEKLGPQASPLARVMIDRMQSEPVACSPKPDPGVMRV